ncbi:TetR/AcrR family transcriptional regulator [Rhodococcus sp. DMU1]|uniref:TetR/AcrR family transcriptional regulator n=1 Tax=Rhodococcus sp. DMU1 TaxID=2722825 RepID=UPI00143E464F|nr:TetR/AcrR family transcriptional regulator [Rhodococcus sp. DMU1]QIX52662.1 TetR/AcrR family transcriptional regulator [Rhodococcus sp. DMU1]
MSEQDDRRRATDRRPRRGGRPTREEAARLDQAVREAALHLFLENGYEGATMNAIAAAAGTTKPSLYARFPTKEAVFRSVLEWAMTQADWPTPEQEPPDLDDLEGALTAVAEAALRRALDPSMIRLQQIAIAYASRYPDIARQALGTGHWPRRQIVVDLLRRHAASGAIVAEDPELLAEHFLGMVSGVAARLASFGIVLDPAEQQRRTRSAVQLFLRSLRP